MIRNNYSKSQKIEILNKCVHWCNVERKSLYDFTKEFNVSKASLYNWSREFNIDIRQTNRLKVAPERITEANSFVKISDLPKSKVIVEKRANINIKTLYCEISISEDLSKESFIALLESLKVVG